MTKANRKAIEAGNFWDTRWIHGRLASGKPKINYKETKARHDKIKERKRQEKKLLKQAKHNSEHKLYDRVIQIHKSMVGKKIKITKKTDQIQYGFDIANWWNEQHA